MIKMQGKEINHMQENTKFNLSFIIVLILFIVIGWIMISASLGNNASVNHQDLPETIENISIK